MSKLIEFEPPKGFEMPEGVEADKEFSAMVELRMGKDGKLCLLEVEGNPMPGYTDDDADEGEKNPHGESDFAYKYQTAMAGTPPDQ